MQKYSSAWSGLNVHTGFAYPSHKAIGMLVQSRRRYKD
jgi:hypothetical protein